MKKLLLPVIAAVAVLLSIPSQSNAAYDASWDWKISLNTKSILNIKPSGFTGDATFQLQEGVHNTLKTTSGVELDHSYIWIEVNGVKILAIDPIKPIF
ncbi:hypothetical protein [Bacillus suaedaesalsae]|uniref:Uncharacterized protein n=1 Tax=Bacillus suaedaesalsae TaxID=2810349 RepID=A0ABS2DE09_9BACI|nr:hypothetical protein [Bacillus suaedaesalsae]MBM6616703.1 hypothetical protein [Bacillus suaedaesalsae]